jgi:hypothetical protein
MFDHTTKLKSIVEQQGQKATTSHAAWGRNANLVLVTGTTQGYALLNFNSNETAANVADALIGAGYNVASLVYARGDKMRSNMQLKVEA